MSLDALVPFFEAHPVFRREELRAHIAEILPNKDLNSSARSLLGYAMRKGRITSIRNGLYAVPASTGRKVNPLLVAGRASPDAVIGFHAALRWHTDQRPPSRIHIYSSTLQDEWEFQGITYLPVHARLGPTMEEGTAQGVEGHRFHGMNVRMTTVERTLADALDRQDFVKDFSATWNLLAKLPAHSSRFQFRNLVAYLERLGCAATTAKVGYFLAAHRDMFGLAASDLAALPELPSQPHPWVPRTHLQQGYVNETWNLRIPEELRLPELDPPLSSAALASRLKPGIRLNELELEAELRKRFGRFRIKKFRDGQERLVKAVLEGRDALAVLPTGAGKSLTYQFPATFLAGVTLVISPLISLMQDQVLEARAKGLTAFALRSRAFRPGAEGGRGRRPLDPSGISKRASRSYRIDWNNYRDIRRALAAGTLNLLFLAPESLDGALRSLPELKRWVTQIVVDEAHVIHEWGADFRTEYRELGRIRTLFPEVPILAMTATANERTRSRILQTLDLQNFEEAHFSVVRRKLFLRRQRVVEGIREKREALMAFIGPRRGKAGIVYCGSRPEAERVAEFLRAQSIRARHYHAGMTSAQRQATQNAFMRGRCDVMVATIAFGMGINKRNVRYVVHFGLPRSLLGYVQEIGRAGRDADPADCLLIHGPRDADQHRWRIREGRRLLRKKAALADDDLPAARSERFTERGDDLATVETFASTENCLHQFIASHFQEVIEPCQFGCENCLDPELHDLGISSSAPDTLNDPVSGEGEEPVPPEEMEFERFEFQD